MRVAAQTRDHFSPAINSSASNEFVHRPPMRQFVGDGSLKKRIRTGVDPIKDIGPEPWNKNGKEKNRKVRMFAVELLTRCVIVSWV
jgi:hypothetical protein